MTGTAGRRIADQAAAGLAALVLCGAAYFTLRYAINADNAAMLEFARRLLGGGRIGVDVYDNNPPLSILIYLPAALLAAGGMPGWIALNCYILILIGLSAWLMAALLGHAKFVDRPQRTTIIYAFILANFLIPGIAFGERDQIVLLGLAPLLLTQAAINGARPLPWRLMLTGLGCGALAICVKPHYALVPAVMIAWRLARQPGMAALLRPDVIVLAFAAAIYGMLLFVFAAEFIHVILPDAASLYAEHIAIRPFPNWRPLLTASFVLAMATVCFRGEARTLFASLALGALAAYGAYLLQIKGYAYHLIPCGVFIFVAGCAMAASLTNRGALSAAAGGLILLVLYPVHPAYPTHARYAALPLAQMVRQECGAAPCSFMVDNEFAFMTFETALYTGSFSASRFTGYWFESALACGQRPDLFPKYAGMIAADLQRWRPAFIALLQAPDHCPGEAGRTVPFDFGTFYGRDPAFAAQWSRYKFERTARFDRRDYFRGTSADYSHMLIFAVYRRTP